MAGRSLEPRGSRADDARQTHTYSTPNDNKTSSAGRTTKQSILRTMAAPSSKAAAEAASQGLSMGGKVFFGGLCAGTFGLGVWQIERFFEKIQKMEARSIELAMEPTTSLGNSNISGGGAQSQPEQSYRRRHLQGVWRHDREVLVGPRGAPSGVQMPLQGLSAAKAASGNNNNNNNKGSSTTTSSGLAPGPQGYHVLTPLQLAPGTADRDMVWVNRGWVPKKLVPGAEGQYRSGRGGGGPMSVAEEAAQWSSYPAWNRDEGLVKVTAVHSKVESK